jgi:hypothetical protein
LVPTVQLEDLHNRAVPLPSLEINQVGNKAGADGGPFPKSVPAVHPLALGFRQAVDEGFTWVQAKGT